MRDPWRSSGLSLAVGGNLAGGKKPGRTEGILGIYNVRSTHCRRRRRMRFHAVSRAQRWCCPRRDRPPSLRRSRSASTGAWWRRCRGRWRSKRACSSRPGLHRRHRRQAPAAGRCCADRFAGELPYAEIATSAAIAGPCGRRAQGGRVILEPHRRVHLGGQARRRYRVIKEYPVGKKVAYTSPKSITEMVIRTALKRAGVGRQGRDSSARRPGPALIRAGAGRGRGRAVQ